ncbi:MAG: DHA2 family efflux MFS transporter permease subunit [Verrucomicrobia bacterium]|nr:DHA2 family efflux MFS transporter permease subunit [Verrucomicrobiota bacterium]
MSAAASAASEWRPKANPWLIAGAVMAATFMEVLDTSVANVSLNHIAGNLSASLDEATWVLTSYLVSNAVILPASGWLGRRFGRRRFLMTCIAIFTVASALCGMANSLGFLIVARILQGAGGGALQPVAQAVLLETFPPEKRGSAMSVYAMGVVVAPILGPTLGGWITDNYSWRWAFYINLPIGIIAIAMCWMFLEDPPYLKSRPPGRIDAIGLGLLIVWIGCLQVFLDKGQDEDWFSSDFIRWLALFAVVGLIVFVIWELTNPSPLVNLQILKDRNVAIGVLMNFTVGAVLYGTVAVLPQFLQVLLGYPSLQAGMVVSPRGIGAIVGSIVAGRILSRIDGRVWMAQGAVVLAATMFILGGLTLEIAPSNVIFPMVISGFGVTSIFVPMTTYSMATVSREQMGDATGITSLVRNLGGSVGISVLTTLVTRGTQAHQALLTGHLTPYDYNFQTQLQTLQHSFGGGPGSQREAYAVINQTLQQQAALWAYVDQFRNLFIICLLLVPLVFLFKRASRRPAGAAAAAH